MIESNQTKLCPACAEEIKLDALKCKHCGEWLDDNQSLRTSAPVQLPQRSVNETPDISEEVARGLRRKQVSDARAAPSYGAAAIIAFVLGVGAAALTGAAWIGIIVFLVAIAFFGAKAEKERKF